MPQPCVGTLPLSLPAIEDGLQHNLRKLQESETDSVRRITEIERRLVDTVGNLVTNKVDERMDSRLNAVENSVKRTLDRKLEASACPDAAVDVM